MNKPSLLIVGDDAPYVEYLAWGLCDRYSVTSVSDPIRGLRVACQNPPDIVILDAAMLQQSSIQVLRHLRSDPRTRASSILLMTLESVDASRWASLQAEGVGASCERAASLPAVRERLARLVPASLAVAREAGACAAQAASAR